MNFKFVSILVAVFFLSNSLQAKDKSEEESIFKRFALAKRILDKEPLGLTSFVPGFLDEGVQLRIKATLTPHEDRGLTCFMIDLSTHENERSVNLYVKGKSGLVFKEQLLEFLKTGREGTGISIVRIVLISRNPKTGEVSYEANERAKEPHEKVSDKSPSTQAGDSRSAPRQPPEVQPPAKPGSAAK